MNRIMPIGKNRSAEYETKNVMWEVFQKTGLLQLQYLKMLPQ